jgi:cytochrome c biogenesis protein ResB
MSPSTARIDKGKKKDLYQRTFRTPDYFVFDPFEPNAFQGWHLDGSGGYQLLQPNDRGWLWCETLGFWLGTWEGTIDRETAVWLRFYDTEGNLVLLPEEAERQKAEQAQQLAEQAQQFAEQAQQLAEAERQKAEAERQKAEAERQRAERLAERLRAIGLDPDHL